MVSRRVLSYVSTIKPFTDQSSPGRWFAVLMIKTMLTYLTRHYEMEWTGSQNELNVIGDAALPPISATIKVRRRKSS